MRQLHLNLNINTTGYHRAAWRAPYGNRFGAAEVENYLEAARIAARGYFDAVFLSDALAYPRINAGGVDHTMLDPYIIAACVFSQIPDIGVIITTSAIYSQPYQIARALSSLDHISNGRVGINIVTGLAPWASANFGMTAHPDADERWQRARELIEIISALWTSWDRDALVGDRASGMLVDTSRVHPINYHGQFYSVAGPFQLPRSAQDRPLVFQAGPSERARNFATHHVDGIFGNHHSEGDAAELHADMAKRLAAVGREKSSVAIMPGLHITLGSTEKEAYDRVAELEDLLTPAYRIALVATMAGIPADALELDKPIPLELIEGRGEIVAPGGYNVDHIVRVQRMTVREISVRGYSIHRRLIGTPEMVANDIIHWFESGLADGFNVSGDVYPSGIEAFVDHVVPILQKRGIYRTGYQPETLRERYGLPSRIEA